MAASVHGAAMVKYTWQKKKGIRPVITLECTECQERNYTTEKNRRNDPSRMELKKYCPRCKEHTLHREVK